MNRPRRSNLCRSGGALALCALLVYAPSSWSAEAEAPAPGMQAGGGLEELFGEISSNMDLIERMLNSKKSGEECQSSQKKLVSKIDELIEALKKMQSSSSGGGGSGSQQSQGGQGSKDQQAEKEQREIEKMRGRTPQDQQQAGPEGAQKETEKEPKEGSGGPQKDTRERQGKEPNDDVKRATPPPAEPGDAMTEKRGTGGWGFLPGEVRALIEASGRPSVPAKYEGIIRRYFERLSEGDKIK